jgi:ubiquinone/menaquinone biosynthesis C-methylase UbiE
MLSKDKAKKYNDWYQSTYGSWVGQLEFSLLTQFLPDNNKNSLLDVGCGTGFFSRKFSHYGLDVTGIDPDLEMITCAQQQIDTGNGVQYILADGLNLPFAENKFSYCSAITSLCFIDNPHLALTEMWRVSHTSIILGLLNRHSLLYLQKKLFYSNQGGYKGARWDSKWNMEQWLKQLSPQPSSVQFKSVLFIPEMGFVSKIVESLFSNKIPWGGFLAVCIYH